MQAVESARLCVTKYRVIYSFDTKHPCLVKAECDLARFIAGCEPSRPNQDSIK